MNIAYNGVVYDGLLHWGARKWVEGVVGKTGNFPTKTKP